MQSELPPVPEDLPRTRGALLASGWRSRSVKDEVRDNLVAALREFEGELLAREKSATDDYALGVGDVWTNDQGWARISVPPSGYVMYGRTHHQGTVPNNPARRTRQEYEAAADMDMRPAGEWWGEPIKFAAEANEEIAKLANRSSKTIERYMRMVREQWSPE